jgi:hypothetical protein
MAPTPAMTREAALTLTTVTVGISYCCYDIAYGSHFEPLQGEDWDELERKAAKCKANLLSKVISYN